jgi:DNA uptake protein ComE-like DNA-binding protein
MLVYQSVQYWYEMRRKHLTVVYAPTAGLLEALEGTSNQICEGSASVTTTMVKASYKSLAHLNLNTASENDGAFQLLIVKLLG